MADLQEMGYGPEVRWTERQRKAYQKITETTAFQPVVCDQFEGVAKKFLEEPVISMQILALSGRNWCFRNLTNNNTKTPLQQSRSVV